MKNLIHSKIKPAADNLSLVLPVHNEVYVIESVIREWVLELSKNHLEFKIIVCEDGSSDGTSELLKRIQKKYSLVLSQKKMRRGYGGAVIDGILTAKSTYILSIDSDGQCDPHDLANFWKNRNQADVLIGRRIVRADPEQRKLFSLMFRVVFKVLFPTSIHDPSAPFVLYKKSMIEQDIPNLRYLKEGFWWGFIGTCVKKKRTIIEFPINHRKRNYGETQVYTVKKLPSIILRNLFGLIKLRVAK